MPSVYLISTALAFVVLQIQPAVASSLLSDPYTTCTSYDINNKNFPGRGSEIDDDGTCTVTNPGDPKQSGRKLEADSNDDIAKLEAFFGTKMETKLENLPTSVAHKPTPWNTRLWLMYEDSFNFQWDEGQPSATEKYARAFGLDVKTFMDDVSAQSGIDSFYNVTTACTSDSECQGTCAIRTDATSGYCIAKWYGFSHAWAPASLFEPEPKCPVTINGITFEPVDLEGLITAIYDGANTSTVFTGNRFNGANYSEDQYGRKLDPTYRDSNPGFFHIAATNMLGKLNTPFIIDRNTDAGVWNIAVGGFKVYNQTAMTPAEAAQKFYAVDSYPFNEAAKSIAHVFSHLSWSNETFAYSNGTLANPVLSANYDSGEDYEYLLELNEANEIIGGEWLQYSYDYHPDFLWFPKGKPAADTVTSIGLSYANVTMLLEKSAACSS